jgi:hypothetical protein
LECSSFRRLKAWWPPSVSPSSPGLCHSNNWSLPHIVRRNTQPSTWTQSVPHNSYAITISVNENLRSCWTWVAISKLRCGKFLY